MGQTSVNPLGQPQGYAGLIADSSEVSSVAGFSEEVSASIPFGTVVKQGAAPQGVLKPTSNVDVFVGVVVNDRVNAPGPFGDIDAAGVGLVPGSVMQVLRRGRIWTEVDAGASAPASIAPNVDRPFVRYAAHGAFGTIVGAVSNVTDAGTNTDMTKVGVFRSPLSLSADGVTPIAIVEWDFTNKP